MLMLISPAKTLEEVQPSHKSLADFELTQPHFAESSAIIASELKQKSFTQIAELMHISEKLSELNYARFQQFPQSFNPQNSYPAIFAFKGDVYRPLELEQYGASELKFANNNLRILSGLYGLLRPLDLLYPYRLEMGTKLKIGAYQNLYEFWGEKITHKINEDANGKPIINLASAEYFKAVKRSKLNSPLINVEFKEHKNGAYKIVGVHAKPARGMMVNFVVRNAITNHQELKKFNAAGYEFAAKLSDANNYIFTRS